MLTHFVSTPRSAHAQSDAVGYDGALIQLRPIMVLARDERGSLSYRPLVIRLRLGPANVERSACFSIPIVHEQLVIHFSTGNLTYADFIGTRQEILKKQILDVAISATAPRYYSAVELVGDLPTPLEPRSQAMTNQCR